MDEYHIATACVQKYSLERERERCREECERKIGTCTFTAVCLSLQHSKCESF